MRAPKWFLCVLLAGSPASAQVLSDQSLTGKYFFRHLSLATNGRGDLTDPRSLIGTITFTGTGRYSFTAQQLNGSAAPVLQTGSGAYTVDPAGIVTMDNPLRGGMQINARLGPEALIGSSTEATGETFDLWVAIPAPSDRKSVV